MLSQELAVVPFVTILPEDVLCIGVCNQNGRLFERLDGTYIQYKGTRIVQADSDSESRPRSPGRLPAGWDRTVESDISAPTADQSL
jgi:hypothetical protein